MEKNKKTPEEIISDYKKRKNKIFSISFRKIFGKMDFSIKNADKSFLALLVALTFFGSYMVISTLSYQNINNKGTIRGPITSQLLFLSIGYIGFIFFQAMDYHKINYNKMIILGIFVLLANIYVYFFGYAEYGAKRWIKISENISFQPSELVKYFLAAFSAYVMSQNSENKKLFKKRYFSLLTILFMFAAMIAVLQSNLSTAGICFGVVIAIIYASETDKKWTVIPFGIGALAGVIALAIKPYRLSRIEAFVKNIFTPGSGSDQLNKSLYALGLGGLTGTGLGSSRMKAFWLPIAENDFIFAIICEELGFIGASLLFFAFLYFVYRGIKISDNAPDKYGYLLGLSLILVIILQIIINISVVIGLFPVTGVTLPFISKGGTSLIINLWAMGIILNISKQSKK